MHSKGIRNHAAALYSSGLSIREVSRHLLEDDETYVSPQTVARWMRDLGKSRSTGEPLSVELNSAAKRLYESGMSLDQVAKKFGVSRTAVANRLHRLGVSIRPSGSQFLHILTERRLRDWYLRRGWSGARIAEEVGCSIATVHRVLKIYRISRRC